MRCSNIHLDFSIPVSDLQPLFRLNSDIFLNKLNVFLNVFVSWPGHRSGMDRHGAGAFIAIDPDGGFVI